MLRKLVKKGSLAFGKPLNLCDSRASMPGQVHIRLITFLS